MTKHIAQICQNCRYWTHEDISDGHVCTNSDSEYVADWVEEDDWCDEFEERKEERG